MKGWLFYTLIAALVFTPICLWAEDIIVPEDTGTGYSFTAGVMFAINSNLPNNTARPLVGIAWFGPAGETFGDNSAIGLSAEWINYEKADGDSVSLFPLLLNLKIYGAASGWRLFTTLGAGILATSDEIPELGLNNGGNFGWTGKLGIDFTNEFFVQANFIASSDPSRDGFAGVQLGYRF
ncbi:MAG: hypothetical protein NT018_03920 [Armatimonadetes bacterium]|nr:hypothetical protein [Armatimonadota bacterium]